MTEPSANITFRPIRSGDEPLLCRIYASTRQDELAPLDWPEEEKEAFLRQQFEAQHQFYQAEFSKAEFNKSLELVQCAWVTLEVWFNLVDRQLVTVGFMTTHCIALRFVYVLNTKGLFIRVKP